MRSLVLLLLVGCSTRAEEREACPAMAQPLEIAAGNVAFAVAPSSAMTWSRDGRVVLAASRAFFSSDDATVESARASAERTSATSMRVCLATADGKKLGTLEVRLDEGRAHLTMGASFARYGFDFDVASARHLYGQGIVTAERNVPRKIASSAEQRFPLERSAFERSVFTTAEGSNVVTPLWLTATGGAIFVDSYAYLHVAMDREKLRVGLVPERGEKELELDLLAAKSTREVYTQWAMGKWKARPALPVRGRPSDELFAKPIWTTWAEYKTAIDRDKVLGFAKTIQQHGLPASWLEIDDKWTPTYGDLEPSLKDARAMVDELHAMGLKVSFWIPPYVTPDARAFAEGTAARAFVGAEGEPYPAKIAWWNTAWQPTSAAIDFFTEGGRAWWGGKVDAARAALGADGFKYDGGEAAFNPVSVVASAHPNAYPDLYARWAKDHAGVEVRAGYFAQDLPILVRQFDKESRWGFDNGLAAVLTQYLQMGLVGYPYVLPDMVGGNEYFGSKVDDELFARWIELNAMLPFVQMSIAPWRLSAETVAVTKKYLALHESLVPYFLSLAEEAQRDQTPLVRPLFFEFPDDAASYEVEDEVMIGSRYLVAPVLTAGARSRKVYLPPGRWKAYPQGGEMIEGGRTIEVNAPIDALPAFER